MRGSDPIDSRYHKRMEERERELQRMTERKERDIEKRIGADNRIKDKKRKQRSTIEWSRSDSVKRSRSETVKRSRGESVKRSRSESVRRTTSQKVQPRSVQSKPQEFKRSIPRPDQADRRLESRPVYREPNREARDYRTADNARTIRRVIKTVVILYLIFGLFAGLVPRLVGNLGEFVTDLRDEFATPEPEYEFVTEEAIVEEKVFIRTDSMEFVAKIDDWQETIDQAQSFLAFDYSPEDGKANAESWLSELEELPFEEVTPPESLATYWDFCLQEYEWTVMMMAKTVNGESAAADFEQLNLLQYDKFAELVRVWNEEGVAYNVSFRTYDYRLVPQAD